MLHIHHTANVHESCVVDVDGFSFTRDTPRQQKEFSFPVRIKANAYLAPLVVVERGMHRDTIIGKNTIIDSFTIIGHDSQIGNDCELDPNVQVLGHVTIGDGTRVGTGAILHPKITIGRNCVVGAGCYLRKDLPDNHTCYVDQKTGIFTIKHNSETKYGKCRGK